MGWYSLILDFKERWLGYTQSEMSWEAHSEGYFMTAEKFRLIAVGSEKPSEIFFSFTILSIGSNFIEYLV